MNAEPAPDAAYSVGDGDLARDAEAAVAVWRASLGQVEGRAAKFAWFYRDAPVGALLQVLRFGPGGEVVGTAGVGWRTMRVGARQLRAGLLADMAVLSGHRLLGPALQLQRAACERALQACDLVYGFPNQNAVPVVKRLGYRHVGDMVLLVCALRHAPYLQRMLPAPLALMAGAGLDLALRLRDGLRDLPGRTLEADWHDTPLPDAHPPLAHDDCIMRGERDAETLDWRFSRSPLAAFRFLYLRRRGEATPCAWFACQRDGDVLRIADFHVGAGLAPQRALARLSREARSAGCRALAIECCLPEPEMTALRRHGFRERQRRPIYARWNGDPQPFNGLRITVFDEDE
ncbi:hypothetical protein [Luteimonas kalidii]|uniref:N-acetyltransferase domain-containing protein n=1 Tax=Luteimonas kalidii TaxID=3042025 RepID=A0ABT6JP45_9GAMM|nr:hypothetical protein [Luteimonas kalidii]MDH5832463.1 hypothetical protein [Luteimonas kalidii]